ncbi:MAG: hypothetical protein IJX55_11400 [Clostridia bacterium]|nr:hypothetical protein [Clostridia bacterium]
MKKLKKILALAMAVMAIVCALSVNVSAASCGSVNLYNNSGDRIAWCTMYTGATSQTPEGKIETLYAYAQLYKTYLPDEFYTETYLTYTYIDEDTFLETEGPWYGKISENKFSEVGLNVNTTELDVINARAKYRVDNKYIQICRNFNNDGTTTCSHALASGTACRYDMNDWTSFDVYEYVD